MTTTPEIRAFIRYEVQALLAINPAQPKWCRITIAALNGWWAIEKHPGRVRNGVNGDHMYSDSLAFDNLPDALHAMGVLLGYPQQHQLRVNKTTYTFAEEVVFEPAIMDTSGKPNSGDSPFWRRPRLNPEEL